MPQPAYARQLLAHKHVKAAASPDGIEVNCTGFSACFDAADDRNAVAEAAQNADGSLSIACGHEGNEPALVRDIKRIKPENFARSAHRIGYRNCGFFHSYRQLARFGDFDQSGC
jgi:hypothetical protein